MQIRVVAWVVSSVGLVACAGEPELGVESSASFFPQSTANQGFDHFGYALAAGDFDGDGFDELAVGVPGRNLSHIEDAGLVRIFKNSPGQTWITEIDSFPCPDYYTLGDGLEFGSALATGDFDGDGYDDLAVGMPNGRLGGGGTIGDGGAVYVYRGTPEGLDYDLQIDQTGLGDDDIEGDRFGAALAAGRITGTVGAGGGVIDELVIGAPGEVNAAGMFVLDNGAVFIVHQPGSGTQVTRIANGTSGAEFGAALAVGDLDGEGHADVAVGAPGNSADKGRTYVYAGRTPPEPKPGWSAMVTYKTYVEPTSPVAGDRSGSAVAIGNLIGLPVTTRELAVGMPGRGGTGAVAIYTVTSLFAVSLARTLVDGAPESGDQHGAALAIGPVTSTNSYEDLVIGIPGEDASAGKIAIWHGGASALAMTKLLERTQQGLTNGWVQYLHEAGDRFGAALAIGYFDDDGAHDLGVGAPNEQPEVEVIGPGPEGLEAGFVYQFDGGNGGITFQWGNDQEVGP